MLEEIAGYLLMSSPSVGEERAALATIVVPSWMGRVVYTRNEYNFELKNF